MQLDGYDADSKEAIVLFPLFQNQRADAEVLDRTLEHHAVRSACWAHAVMGALHRCFRIGYSFEVLRGDIRVGSGGAYSCRERVLWSGYRLCLRAHRYEPPVGVNPHCGKKLAIFGDEELADYEWVLQVDSDLFVASPKGMSYPFFEELFGREQEIGSLRINYEECSLEEDLRWHEFAGISAEAWYALVSEYATPRVSSLYRTKQPAVASIHGAMTLFPAKRFFADRQSELRWILESGHPVARR